MDAHTNTSGAEPGALQLDQAALEAAKQHADEGVVTPAYGPWRQDVLRLLNDALATVSSPKIAEEFMVHALEETAHGDQIAERIVQLGGEPDFAPDSLTQRSHADYDDATDLKSMIKANLIAERVAIEAYTQMIHLIGDKDSTTRRMLEGILSQEQEHVDELSDWMTDN